MHIRALKYGMIWTGIGFGLLSLIADNWLAYSMPIYTFALVPFIELFLKPDKENMNKTELEIARADKLYDWMLYLMVPVQYTMLVIFVIMVSQPGVPTYVIIGKIWAFGIGAGVLGINVAHELGHRRAGHEKLMSKLLLL
ncbi:MAG: alkane 1-monooxygenase, partial [Bacteroidota bacterium]